MGKNFSLPPSNSLVSNPGMLVELTQRTSFALNLDACVTLGTTEKLGQSGVPLGA